MAITTIAAVTRAFNTNALRNPVALKFLIRGTIYTIKIFYKHIVMASETDTSLVGILVAAFTFIISLAWNDAFKAFFTTSTPFLRKYGPWAYAIAITFIGFGLIQLIVTNKFVNNLQKKVQTKDQEAKEGA